MTSLPRQIAAAALLAGRRIANAVARPRPGSFRMLMLHDVPAGQRAALEDMVRRLAAAGRLIDPETAATLLTGSPASDGNVPVVLSFDDGFSSNAEIAETILDRYGVKALFFICPGLINLSGPDQRNAIAAGIFDGRVRGYDLAPDHRVMTWDEIERLAARGHVFGSHTMTHRRLAGMAGALVEEEVAMASATIRQRLGETPEWFAYPFGDIDSIDASALAIVARHHRFCRSGVRGINHPQTSHLALLAENIDLASGAIVRTCAAEGGFDPLYSGARRRLARYAADACAP